MKRLVSSAVEVSKLIKQVALQFLKLVQDKIAKTN